MENNQFQGNEPSKEIEEDLEDLKEIEEEN